MTPMEVVFIAIFAVGLLFAIVYLYDIYDKFNKEQKLNKQLSVVPPVTKVKKIPYDRAERIEFFHDYFYSVGLIKTIVPRVKYTDKKEIDTYYLYPLYKQVKSDYHNVFKFTDWDYDPRWYSISKLDTLYEEMYHIYKEIRKNEGLFYLIIKYNVKYNFSENFDRVINSESLQKKAVDSLIKKIKDTDDKVLLQEYCKIEDTKFNKEMDELKQAKETFKTQVYSKIEDKKEEYHQEMNTGTPVQENIIGNS